LDGTSDKLTLNPKSQIQNLNGDRTVDSQVIYFVPYSCPRCKAELEAQHGTWEGWLRCPACEHPSLPPEVLFGHPMTRRRIQGHDETIDMATVAPEEPIESDRSPIVEFSPSTAISALRLVFMTGLVVSLFLLLIFYLDQKQQLTGVFAVLAIIFFLLVLRSPKRRMKYED
jgi:hypothetical protein